MSLRPQFHLRQSGQGWLAWDVARLIRLSSGLPVVDVPLSGIAELDEAFWYSDDEDSPTCRSVLGHAQLIHEADLRWPIILDSEGRVMDGMHRICKAVSLGRETIRAVRFDKPVAPDHVGVRPGDLPLRPTSSD